ncbi:hypothetical protein [Blautia glucerasea]|uniref:hypothetical protein n=1 Tax=Blautia glucerasea TaxID=536633 RepID=UPI001D07EE81|nr:hypothetical protein [Blautia glucerasea]
MGKEPISLVTGIYNQIISEKLPENGLECIIVPRKENDRKIGLVDLVLCNSGSSHPFSELPLTPR